MYFLMGCGYTILRDFDQEAKQAELAAIDSLTSAPDLTISNIEYEYVPPQTRRDPLDQMAYPPKVRFYLTATNIGNAAFTKPYLLVFRNLNPRPYQSNTFSEMLRNQRGETIPVNSDQEIILYFDYPSDSTSYRFTIVTNVIIQHQLIEELERHVKRPPIPALSREFRYDNNESEIAIPGYNEILHGAQQQ